MAKAVILNDSNGEEVYPVTDISLVNGELNGAKIVNASVGSDKLTPNAVWNENIKNGAVTSSKIDWATMPVRYTCVSTDNKPTVNMTVNLPPQKASSAYTLYLSTIGGSFSPTEHVVFFRTSGTNVLDATPGKLSSTGQNITSISLSDYNATNHTVQLSVTYDGKVYWQLFVRAYNRGGTY